MIGSVLVMKIRKSIRNLQSNNAHILDFNSTSNPSNKISGEKAMWVWNDSVVSDGKTADLFWLVDRNYIDTLYMVYTTGNDKKWRSFIRGMADHNVEIHALSGDSLWALKSYQDDCEKFIEKVIKYNESTDSDDEKFSGIHLDNEPYTLKSPLDWKDLEDRINMMSQWLITSKAYTTKINNIGMVSGNSIPFWLENSKAVLEAEDNDSNLKDFYKQIIDSHDYSALMSYRDTANSSNGIIPVSENEIDYADKPKIIVGIETADSGSDKTTFYQEGFVVAENALKEVDDHFETHEGYRGVAVHHYDSWLDMALKNISQRG